MNCPKCDFEMEKVIFIGYGSGYQCPNCGYQMGVEDDDGVDY